MLKIDCKGVRVAEGRQVNLEPIAIMSVGDECGLDQGSDGGNRGKWLNSGYVLNVKPPRFPD